MILVDRALEERRADPIRVAIVGAGYMGRGMTHYITHSIPGMTVAAIANRTVERAIDAYCATGRVDVVVVDSVRALERAVAAGRPAVTSDARQACRANGIEVVIEATGEVEFGAQVAVESITNRKHLVLVNAELDATVGPILKVMADRAGVVITNADGDEPGVAMNLVRFVRTIGYQPVMAGNVKGFYDPHRNPDTQRAFAEAHGQRPRMITSFADGTKLSMEGTVLANATGFGIARRGMTGLKCEHVKDVLSLYDLDSLLARPLVDFVLGAEPGSGAFVVGYNSDPTMRAYMKYFKMGEGPFHLFYRPFHLTHLEAPLSAARAVLFGDATIAPMGGPICEVLTFAKRDLAAGEVLDGIGGYTCYGMIDMLAAARAERALAMGLTEGCRMRRAVAQDRLITVDDVELPEGRLVDRLRVEQEALFGA